jgi:hypothetical protein
LGLVFGLGSGDIEIIIMKNLMRINKQFFEKLLYDTEPLEAISHISQFWSPRLVSSLPNFGLSKTEYEVELCLIYFGEVCNGAHFQYFTNRGTQFCNDTIIALKRAGLEEYSEILSNSASNLPSSIEYIDVNDISSDMLCRWEDADEKFYELDLASTPDSDYTFYLLRLLQKNIGEVLTKERGI